MAYNECNSACFLIIAGCADREVSVEIGIHRPYFNPDEFGSLDFNEAKAHYQALLDSVHSYLGDMDISKTLIDKMISVPSESVQFLSIKDFKNKSGKGRQHIMNGYKQNAV